MSPDSSFRFAPLHSLPFLSLTTYCSYCHSLYLLKTYFVARYDIPRPYHIYIILYYLFNCYFHPKFSSLQLHVYPYILYTCAYNVSYTPRMLYGAVFLIDSVNETVAIRTRTHDNTSPVLFSTMYRHIWRVVHAPDEARTGKGTVVRTGYQRTYAGLSQTMWNQEYITPDPTRLPTLRGISGTHIVRCIDTCFAYHRGTQITDDHFWVVTSLLHQGRCDSWACVLHVVWHIINEYQQWLRFMISFSLQLSQFYTDA